MTIEERDREDLHLGVRLLDVMFGEATGLFPYIGWDGELFKLEILIEKLVSCKRELIGASVTTSLQLAEELESFCREFSYRAVSEDKLEVILTLIDIYRSRCTLEQCNYACPCQRYLNSGGGTEFW